MKRGLPPAHPGAHLGEEIKELGLTANAFAEAMAPFFGTSAQMWMNLQTNYDLWHEERAERKAIKNIKPLKRAA